MSFLKQNSDKDECTLNQDQCDRATTLCVNQIPHYTCECLDGYDRVNDLRCTGNHSFASLFSCEKELMCDSPFTLTNTEAVQERLRFINGSFTLLETDSGMDPDSDPVPVVGN